MLWMVELHVFVLQVTGLEVKSVVCGLVDTPLTQNTIGGRVLAVEIMVSCEEGV
jgi:hypothetical protein